MSFPKHSEEQEVDATGAAVDLPGSTVFRILRGVARGMSYLHGLEPPVLHRDLKSPNILISEAADALIADFGLARALALAPDAFMTATGTIQWTAPEVILRDTYSTAADCFSFGVVVWELLTRKLPWDTVPMLRVAQRVAAGERLPLPPLSDDDTAATMLARLARNLFSEDPAVRSSFPEILSLFARADAQPKFDRWAGP